MATVKLDYKKMRVEDPTLYKQLLFSVVRDFIKGLPSKAIVSNVYFWSGSVAKKYYRVDGEEILRPTGFLVA